MLAVAPDKPTKEVITDVAKALIAVPANVIAGAKVVTEAEIVGMVLAIVVSTATAMAPLACIVSRPAPSACIPAPTLAMPALAPEILPTPIATAAKDAAISPRLVLVIITTP